MPTIGEIKHGRDMGLTRGNKYTWQACPLCQKERWVGTYKSKLLPLCRKCAGVKHSESMRGDKCHFWKGGIIHKKVGTVMIKLTPDSFFYPMTDKNHYVLEHRLVMAKSLGRCLQSWEIVHHKNGIKDDNLIENLELSASNGEHIKMHLKGYHDGFQRGLLDGRQKRIKELLSRIATLESEVGLSALV